MSISDEDFAEIKRRLQADNVKLQFGRGSKEQALSYQPLVGEPVVTEDTLEFAVGDGKGDSSNLLFYPTSTVSPDLGDDLDKNVDHIVRFFLRSIPPGFDTPDCSMEGTKLTKEKLVERFEATGKFCVADGRDLPANCYVNRVFGITKAPKLTGNFKRQMCFDETFKPCLWMNKNRKLGSFQDWAMEKMEGDVGEFFSSSRPKKDGVLETRQYNVSTINLSSGSNTWPRLSVIFNNAGVVKTAGETRPANIAVLCFYRFDW